MYIAVNNSPQTTLTASITATDSEIAVASVDALPSAPNLVTIGSDDDAEVVRYNGIDGLKLTGCERGFGGTTAKIWLLNELVYRAYTKYDHDTFVDNITDLSANKLDKTGDVSSATTEFSTAAQRTNVSSGEKLSVSLGKIAKWFADLKKLAFLDSVGTDQISDSSVTNSKLAEMNASTIKGNGGTAKSQPSDLSASDVRKIINVSEGADKTSTSINAASTSDALENTDKLPFVDVSESADNKLKTVLFSTVISKIRTALFGTISGIAKLDGSGNVSAAVGGTDYQKPLTFPLALGSGGTGAATATAALNNLLPSGAEIGKALIKTDTGYGWGEAGGGGGSGEQYLATLTVANWYQQTPDTSEEFWYAYDIAPSDFDSSEQDVVASAANADTYDWLAENAY